MKKPLKFNYFEKPSTGRFFYVRKAAAESDDMSADRQYIEKTIVVTEYDPSILGELAKKIRGMDSTLDVYYTVTADFRTKPLVQPMNTPASGYRDLNWKGDNRVDEGVDFRIQKLILSITRTRTI